MAIRRAEVVDSESPIVSAHLSDSDALPVIWIYDKSGKRVRNMSGTSEAEVRSALEALLHTR